MRIILTSVDSKLTFAWRQYCGDLDFVKIHHGSILDLACDAIVSPANGFGFMDGGIDHLYTEHFGAKVQVRLQTWIRERHHGELLVGQAEIVGTDDPRIPYLIAAPTMRLPVVLDDKTVNAYLAARAVFLLIRHDRFPEGEHEGRLIADVVKSVAFPGLGTGTGDLSPEICARQMRAAIEDFVLGKYVFPSSWMEEHERTRRFFLVKGKPPKIAGLLPSKSPRKCSMKTSPTSTAKTPTSSAARPARKCGPFPNVCWLR